MSLTPRMARRWQQGLAATKGTSTTGRRSPYGKSSSTRRLRRPVAAQWYFAGRRVVSLFSIAAWGCGTDFRYDQPLRTVDCRHVAADLREGNLSMTTAALPPPFVRGPQGLTSTFDKRENLAPQPTRPRPTLQGYPRVPQERRRADAPSSQSRRDAGPSDPPIPRRASPFGDRARTSSAPNRALLANLGNGSCLIYGRRGQISHRGKTVRCRGSCCRGQKESQCFLEIAGFRLEKPKRRVVRGAFTQNYAAPFNRMLP